MIKQQIGSGPEDFSLGYAKLYVDNTEVSDGETVEVDPETTHSLKVPHSVLNADPYSWGDPTGTWRTAVTVYNLTDNKPVGFDYGLGDAGEGGGNSVISVGKISKSVTFRVKVWANQNNGAVAPASSYWKEP